MPDRQLDQLLEAFYDGTSSPEQDEELMNYFRTVQTKDLPSGHEADGLMFKSMSLARENVRPADIPDDLGNSILDATVGHRKKHSRPHILRLVISITAAAACAAIAVISLWPDKQEIPDGPVYADITAKTSPVTSLPVRDTQPPAKVTEQNEAVKAEPSAVKKQHKHKRKLQQPKKNHIEVTDPQEAARITALILASIESSTETAARSASEGLRQTDETLNKIPQKIAKVTTIL